MTTQLLKVIMPSFVYMRWSTIGVTWFTMSSTSAPSRGHAGHGKRRRGICQSSATEKYRASPASSRVAVGEPERSPPKKVWPMAVIRAGRIGQKGAKASVPVDGRPGPPGCI